MKKIALLLSAAACIACSELVPEQDKNFNCESEEGMLAVAIEHASSPTKAQTDYVTVLPDERAVKSVAVFVFDKSTGVLNASKNISTVEEGCTFSVTTGNKTVYAVVNAPALGTVTTVSQLRQIVDDLSESDMVTDGLVMVGSSDCIVEVGKTATPVISVMRLVSRVVLQKITCNIPAQYGSMTVNSVYLGNVNSIQTLAGTSSEKVNPDGYADVAKTKPIGKNSVSGSCAGYLYRNVGKNITVGNSDATKYHMYCQPSDASIMPCLYLLTTIGGNQYYYRVPLHLGLTANTTCSVELEITNLGAPTPPDGDLQKGEIKATVSIAGWSAGNKYEVEF